MFPWQYPEPGLEVPRCVPPASFCILEFVVDGKFVGAGVDHFLVEGGQVEGVPEPQLGVYIELKGEGIGVHQTVGGAKPDPVVEQDIPRQIDVVGGLFTPPVEESRFQFYAFRDEKNVSAHGIQVEDFPVHFLVGVIYNIVFE